LNALATIEGAADGTTGGQGQVHRLNVAAKADALQFLRSTNDGKQFSITSHTQLFCIIVWENQTQVHHTKSKGNHAPLQLA